MLTRNISTHSLTKRLTHASQLLASSVLISTHSLTKRLTGLTSWKIHHRFYFNSQPHEEADAAHRAQEIAKQYFNSQPHEEADEIPVYYWEKENISTHSLTKRLTEAFEDAGITAIFQLTASRRG